MALKIVDPAYTHLTDHFLVENVLEVPVTVSLPRSLESLTITDQMVCSFQLAHFGLFNRYGLCVVIVHIPPLLINVVAQLTTRGVVQS
ncbi:hypothetical protein D3C80_1975430 [compost metagenome]